MRHTPKNPEKAWRRILKNWNKQQPARPIESLMTAERFRGEYETLDEYGFLPESFSALTDEEIDEELEQGMWRRICSPYDCTGKLFTCGIDWHRNPCGRISYVHHMALDV